MGTQLSAFERERVDQKADVGILSILPAITSWSRLSVGVSALSPLSCWALHSRQRPAAVALVRRVERQPGLVKREVVIFVAGRTVFLAVHLGGLFQA